MSAPLTRAITQASRLAATVIGEWIASEPLITSAGGSVFAGTRPRSASTPVPAPDFVERARVAIEAWLARSTHDFPSRIDYRVHRTLDLSIDSGPNRTAIEIGAELGIDPAAWPDKSELAVWIRGSLHDPSCVMCVKRGYHADPVRAMLLPVASGGGWLVGPVVPDEYFDVVIEAVRAGRVAAARIEPEQQP